MLSLHGYLLSKTLTFYRPAARLLSAGSAKPSRPSALYLAPAGPGHVSQAMGPEPMDGLGASWWPAFADRAGRDRQSTPDGPGSFARFYFPDNPKGRIGLVENVIPHGAAAWALGDKGSSFYWVPNVSIRIG